MRFLSYNWNILVFRCFHLLAILVEHSFVNCFFVAENSLCSTLVTEMDRIQDKADENSKSQPSSSSVVALAIKGNKKSKYVVQWALNKFVPEGMIVFKLIHVHEGIKGVPTPSNIYAFCFHYVQERNNIFLLLISNYPECKYDL